MGFNYGIPANKVNSVGTNQGCGVFDGDALLCDQNDCGTVCPGGPPAVSTQKFDQNVAAAFRPSTATPSDSYTNLADANGDFWGTVARRFDLPAASGTFNATCGQLRESDTLTIASSVVVTLLDNGPFSLHFQDPDFPGRFPPIPLILLPHSASGLQPIIILPPKAPQPPETTPGTEPGEPVIGGIIIRCPKRNRRCTGTLTAKARKNGPTLGTTKFSLPGGTDELTQVQPPRRHRRADRRPPQGPRRQEPGQDRHAQGAGQRRHPGPALRQAVHQLPHGDGHRRRSERPVHVSGHVP
ncbi:MAG TPA: hypothetical protein VHW96_19260 [Solirubrobacteraceae bacterium]|nr:hypothetical protein [Solirubrobacteraceae bacterium]